MKQSFVILMFLSAAIFTGCGQKHYAKQLISDFLDKNLNDPNIGSMSYGELDSTIYITDSIIQIMHQQADTMKAFRPKIQYNAKGKLAEKLLFMTVKFKQDNEKHTYTFYFDYGLQEILAFKRN